MSESVIVVDFGGQYNQLIARRVRECHVYSEIVPYTKALDVIKAKRPRGIILQADPTAPMKMGLLPSAQRCLIWASLYWVSATAPSL